MTWNLKSRAPDEVIRERYMRHWHLSRKPGVTSKRGRRDKISTKVRGGIACLRLMTNHIHFLVTPAESDSISRFTLVLGSRYVQYINKTYKCTGTLWEGRHKSSVVDAESYLLKCYRYIELNPVAANMVARPDEYRWSSFGVNGWGDDVSMITPYSEYLRLGSNAEQRSSVYKALFNVNLSVVDLHTIRSAAHYCHPVGDDRFKRQVEAVTGESIGYSRRGRPKKGGE